MSARIKVTLIILAVVLVTNIILFMSVEEKKFLDSLYFLIVTLSTVGFGDFTPNENITKVLTIQSIANNFAKGHYLTF